MNTYIRVAAHNFKNQPDLNFGSFHLQSHPDGVAFDHELDVNLAMIEIEKLEKVTGKKATIIEDNVSKITMWIGFIN